MSKGLSKHKKFFTKKFKIGTHCSVDVPKDKLKYWKGWNGSTVEIISRKELSDKIRATLTVDRVSVRLIDTPDLGRKSMIGFEYCIPRMWLTKITDGKHDCHCDLKRVLMVTGCKCGGK